MLNSTELESKIDADDKKCDAVDKFYEFANLFDSFERARDYILEYSETDVKDSALVRVMRERLEALRKAIEAM